MKVIVLVGSPRRGGNTDLLVDKVLEGAAASGSETEKVYLYDLEIKPCVDCRACKKGSFQCAIKDGIQALYPKLEAAGAIVFGTPLYWYGPTGKMKLLIDRLRPYVASRKLKGKKAAVIVPSEEGAKACRTTISMFKQSFKYLEIELVGTILAAAYEKGEVKQNPEMLAAAFNLGKSIK